MIAIDVLFALGVTLAFLSGSRSTFRLWRRYRQAKPVLLYWRERLIFQAIVAVAVVITIAAAFYGFVAVRRLLGFESLDWTPYVSALIAIGVLFIPTFLDRVIETVARR